LKEDAAAIPELLNQYKELALCKQQYSKIVTADRNATQKAGPPPGEYQISFEVKLSTASGVMRFPFIFYDKHLLGGIFTEAPASVVEPR